MRSLLIALVLVAGRLACAEEPEWAGPPLAVGSLVRVQAGAASEPVQGIVVAIDEHALKLATNGAPSRVPLDSITTAEARVGRGRQVLKGLVFGAGLGVLLSQVWDVDPRLCQGDNRYFCSRGEAVVTGVLGFGAIGAGTGALVRKDRWAPVDVRAGIEQARAAPPPATDPAALPSRAEPLRPGAGSPEASCSDRTLAAGERVRVVAPRGLRTPTTGYLLGSDAATLAVDVDGQTLSLPRESVTRLERSTRRSRKVLGMKIGGGIGFAAGVGVGIALVSAESTGSCDQCGTAVAILGAVGALPGALLGAAVAPGERWVAEDPGTVCVERRAAKYQKDRRRVRVGITPAPGGGVGFRLSVAF